MSPLGHPPENDIRNEARIEGVAHRYSTQIIEPFGGAPADGNSGGEVKSKIGESVLKRVVAPSKRAGKEAWIECKIVVLQVKMVLVPIIPRRP